MRQGFTGEHGYEIWTPREIGPKIWKIIENAGQKFEIKPVVISDWISKVFEIK